MKKSELRNIIRESIKELMTEQVNGMHQSIQMEICDCQPLTASSCLTLAPNMNGNTASRGWTCNGQMCQQSDIGKIFTYTGNLDSGNVDWTSITYKLTGISQPAPISYNPPFNMVGSSCPAIVPHDGYVCQDGNCLDCSNSSYNQYCNAQGATIYPNLVACQTALTANNGSCPGQNTTTSAGSCNSNAWSNHANWTSTFTNTVANHNNPCNFLNNKIAQWTAALQGTGQGNYQNMLNCKLDLANQLHTQNNC